MIFFHGAPIPGDATQQAKFFSGRDCLLSYALKENSHVKIDVIYNRFNKRTQGVISVAGLVSFILPTALFIIYISIDMAKQSWVILEGSSEAGGLNLVFILKSLIPITGILIFLQGISELIKHIRVSGT